jgi:hypothetical protein
VFARERVPARAVQGARERVGSPVRGRPDEHVHDPADDEEGLVDELHVGAR